MVLARPLVRVLAVTLAVLVAGVPLSVFAWFLFSVGAERTGLTWLAPGSMADYAVRALPLLLCAWWGDHMARRGLAGELCATLMGAALVAGLVALLAIPVTNWIGRAGLIRSDDHIGLVFVLAIVATACAAFAGGCLARLWWRAGSYLDDE